MIGRRFADLIKASGQPAAPKGRMDGSSQNRHATNSKKALAVREASMDGPQALPHFLRRRQPEAANAMTALVGGWLLTSPQSKVTPI
jgi:hypothetical protein